MKRNRHIWALAAVLLLAIGVVVCRYALFDLHGMKSLPWVLAALGLLVIAGAAVPDARKVMLCASIGYSVGFAIAMILQREGTDPGGGATSNAWIIWGAAYALFILIGGVMQITGKHRRRR